MSMMRETQRRRLLAIAKEKATKEAAKKIQALLNKKYKALSRELRRANLRKRLEKVLPPYSGFDADMYIRSGRHLEKLSTNGALLKEDGDWSKWIDSFTQALVEIFKPNLEAIYAVEEQYWMDRHVRPDPLDPAEVIKQYEARTGKQIKDIGEDTRDNVLNAVAQWYNSGAPLPDLIDNLEQYFSESRAEMIARTETAFAASQIALNQMNQFGITTWIWDLGDEVGEWPCDECIALAEAGPYKTGDPMPPDASHPNCRCGVLYANEDGSELMYGA